MRKYFSAICFTLFFAQILVSCTKEGPAGKDGTSGIDGINGKDGVSILNGYGEPLNIFGKEGDYYIDIKNSLLYGPKSIDGWGRTAITLKGKDGVNGSDGVNGATILAGAYNPTSYTGNIGDFYLNKSTYTLFGPKTTSGWGAGILLKGENGNANVRAFIFSDPWKYVNGFVGTNIFSFSLFPNISISDVKNGAIDVYLETKRSDTLTGSFMEPAVWTKVGAVDVYGGTGMERVVFMRSTFTAWTFGNDVGAIVVMINLGTNTIKISTLNQAKYWSCIKSIKVVVTTPSLVTYMKRYQGAVNLSTISATK